MVRPGAITKEITQTTSTKTHIITNTTTITNTNSGTGTTLYLVNGQVQRHQGLSSNRLQGTGTLFKGWLLKSGFFLILRGEVPEFYLWGKPPRVVIIANIVTSTKRIVKWILKLRGLFLAYRSFAKDRFFLDLTQRRFTSEKETKILLRILFGFAWKGIGALLSMGLSGPTLDRR